MKKVLLALCAAVLTLIGCTKQGCDNNNCCTQDNRHPAYAYNATIYEFNTRQLTEEGTFAAAEELLPELRESTPYRKRVLRDTGRQCPVPEECKGPG